LERCIGSIFLGTAGVILRWTIYQRSGGVVTGVGQWEGRRGGDSQVWLG